MKKTKKRKSIKEIRLEERLRGFGECYEMFTEYWRKGQRLGGPLDIPLPMWPIIEQADKKYSSLDKDYKKIMWPRVYGKNFDI